MDTTPPKLPRVSDIIRWEYKPGDRLIARLDRDEPITHQQAAQLAGRIRAQLQLPDDAPVVIANSEWSFEVISGPD